jgi:hypothetical protein
MKRENAITIAADGATVTTGATTARVAIPNNSAGQKPLYIRVTAVAEAYVQMGGSAVNATSNSVLVQPADSMVFSVGGHTHIAYIQGAAATRVNIVPLEDF